MSDTLKFLTTDGNPNFKSMFQKTRIYGFLINLDIDKVILSLGVDGLLMLKNRVKELIKIAVKGR